MVRSNPPPYNVGFLSDDRRTNVAVTRARRHVCIVCNTATVSSHDFLKRMVEYFQELAVCVPAAECIIQVWHMLYMLILGDIENFFEELVDEEYVNELEIKNPNLPIPSKEIQNENSSKEKKQRKSKAQKKQEKDVAAEEQRKKWEDERTQELILLKEKQGRYQALSTIEYSVSLSSYERMRLHEIADKLGLVHESKGEGNERKLAISRPTVKNATPSEPQKLEKQKKKKPNGK